MRKATILLLSLCTIASANVFQAAEKPNVIVIMADDIGAEGLNCYDGTLYTTPRLDQMAAEGARFQNAYATPLCTPTRVTGAPVGLPIAMKFPIFWTNVNPVSMVSVL